MYYWWHIPIHELRCIWKLVLWWLNINIYLASLIFCKFANIYLRLLILDIDLRELAPCSLQILLLQLLDFHLVRVDEILSLFQSLLEVVLLAHWLCMPKLQFLYLILLLVIELFQVGDFLPQSKVLLLVILNLRLHRGSFLLELSDSLWCDICLSIMVWLVYKALVSVWVICLWSADVMSTLAVLRVLAFTICPERTFLG